jgi:hypothetical protein
MSPEGKPVQVNASALQAAGAQNAMGNTVTIMSPDGKPNHLHQIIQVETW